MEFELTREIADQIIFAMEDQNEEFLVDVRTGDVVAASQAERNEEEDERYVEAPDWRPVDGFHLMERFLTELRDPLLREKLRAALSSGRGVFRNFKDTLRQSPGAERRWYLFKERQMRRVVFDWYNEMREVHGLQRLSLDVLEEEGARELLLSDFWVRTGEPADAPAALAMDRSAFEAIFGGVPGARVRELYEHRCSVYPALEDERSRWMVAEDSAHAVAGMAWAVETRAPVSGKNVWMIIQLAVDAAFRGLGLGALLLERLLERLYEDGASGVAVKLAAGAIQYSELFSRHGFAPAAQVLMLSLDEWRR